MIDTHSDTWVAVAAHAELQLAAARRSIEAPDLDPLTTQFQRGRIAALRDLVELPARQARTLRVSDAASY
jgi:hypothetical protein